MRATTMRIPFLVLAAVGLGMVWLLTPTGVRGADLSPGETEETVGIARGKTKQGYPFMAGGVGTGERRAMEGMAKGYNLKLSFAEKSGQYLSGVEIVIEDEKGEEIVRSAVDGPWFYIQLPPGKYNISATVEGRTKRIRALDVPEKRRVLRLLHWDLESEG